MSNFEVLDSVVHSDLRVRLQFGEAFRNNVNQCVVFPTEFQALQREYPIYFRKSGDQTFYAVALLGLDKDENLFLDSGYWNARYVPAVQMRGPFALEIRDAKGAGPEGSDPVVRIDRNDPRVNTEEGENIFLSHGGYSPYFEEMLQVLRRIHVGAETVDDFFSHLQSFNLIEPVTIQASVGDTLQYTVPDVFTISKKRMAELSADDLYELNRLGLLEHCFAVMSSAGNIARLVDLKIRKPSQFR